MTAAIQRGLTLSDFKEMDIGSIIDYVIIYNNNYYKEDDKEKATTIRKATQADFDRF